MKFRKSSFQLCMFMTIAFSHQSFAVAAPDVSDLKVYFAEVKSRPAKPIEPIPEVKSTPPYTYDVEGTRDPFVPLERELRSDYVPPSGSDIMPDKSRPRELLETYPLDSIRFVGTMSIQGAWWAIVQSSDGVKHRLKEGNHLGQNYGEITSISKHRMAIKEIIPNGLGQWEYRNLDLDIEEIDTDPKGVEAPKTATVLDNKEVKKVNVVEKSENKE